MKNTWNLCSLVLTAIILCSLCSCEEDDNEKEWGTALIYMPQAAILNGGVTNNNYPVPLNSNTSKNYVLNEEQNLLHITLGVYRSGLQALESYSVTIAAMDAATVEAAAKVANGIVLPAGVYELPDEIIVPDGQRQASFHLTVDLNQLGEEYIDRSIVLVVAISGSSKYELNKDLCQTTVIIDGKIFIKASE
jgi:hypothetical protein